jgi:hypothetical protein
LAQSCKRDHRGNIHSVKYCLHRTQLVASNQICATESP